MSRQNNLEMFSLEKKRFHILLSGNNRDAVMSIFKKHNSADISENDESCSCSIAIGNNNIRISHDKTALGGHFGPWTFYLNKPNLLISCQKSPEVYNLDNQNLKSVNQDLKASGKEEIKFLALYYQEPAEDISYSFKVISEQTTPEELVDHVLELLLPQNLQVQPNQQKSESEESDKPSRCLVM